MWALLQAMDIVPCEDDIDRLIELGRSDDDASGYVEALNGIFNALFDRGMEEPSEELLRMAVAMPTDRPAMPSPTAASASSSTTSLSGGSGYVLDDVNEFVLGGFLTETHARKGRFARMINVVTNGRYDIGADSANVIVVDRATGQLIEEKIPVYIRLSIRALYKNKFSTVRKGTKAKGDCALAHKRAQGSTQSL